MHRRVEGFPTSDDTLARELPNSLQDRAFHDVSSGQLLLGAVFMLFSARNALVYAFLAE